MEKPDFSNMMSSVTQWSSEQEWYQQLKAKWDELDPQSRMYLQVSISIGVTALVGYTSLSFLWSVHSLRQEAADKTDILMQLQSANDELTRLKSVNANLSAASAMSNDPWPSYFETTALPIGIGKGMLTTSDSKAGTTNDLSKEALFDLAVKKINVHQLVRLAYALENGARPVKLRNLVVDTTPDNSGYMDATLSVSAYTMINTANSGK